MAANSAKYAQRRIVDKHETAVHHTDASAAAR